MWLVENMSWMCMLMGVIMLGVYTHVEGKSECECVFCEFGLHAYYYQWV